MLTTEFSNRLLGVENEMHLAFKILNTAFRYPGKAF